jgi:hypothetical protein
MSDDIYYTSFGYHTTAKWYPYFPRTLMLLSSGLEIVEAENSFIS